jgi:hypothetical protein
MTFALQTASGQYVTAVNGGGIGGPNDGTCPIHTDAKVPAQWEQFTLNVDVSANPPTVQIQTATGNYLTAINGGGVGDAPGGDGSTPVRTIDNAVQAWQVFSLPGGPPPQAQSQAYTFTLPKFTCNKMRSNNWLGTERDTDYAYLSVMVNNGAPTAVTQKIGTVDSNSTYKTTLSIPSINIADNDNVTIQYHIINSSSSDDQAIQILKQIGEKLGSTVATWLVTTGVGALGAALGAAVGTGIFPLVGTALGAIVGWVLSQIWTQLDANCDGPVAGALHFYTGAQLRLMTANAPFVSSEDNPGQSSPTGCGNNSDYVVEWSVSAG